MTVRLVIARPLPGTVGEARRQVHVFREEQRERDPMTALCGTAFPREWLEFLPDIKGMPCVSCVASTPWPSEEDARRVIEE